MSCSKSEDRQTFPSSGILGTNKNLYFHSLLDRLHEDDDSLLYSYVMTSIQLQDSTFVQTGSGPNFQGDLVTLCTCKHRMRTARGVNEWPGIWLAGFSSRKTGGNWLVYLMKISRAFESHYDLWNWLKPEIRRAKSAHLHRLGDVFEPKSVGIHPEQRFRVDSYRPPHKYHSHSWNAKSEVQIQDWHNDIDYQGFSGRHHALLVADPEMSFVWSKPIISYQYIPHPRTKKWYGLQKFLQHLSGHEEVTV